MILAMSLLWIIFRWLDQRNRKIYQTNIGMIKEDGLWMPINPETQETVGYCFIEFGTREEAELAKKKTDGYKLDTGHAFAVNLMEEFDRLINTPDKWITP
ncbi:hypothetical protein ACH5RR_040431 [Cinchona calisaya]|uniref:RRM domain-containing protein n=1 Tax=Cinchona calisaya TaxID=153742 RepID=A0ABD2XRV7_9GENT